MGGKRFKPKVGKTFRGRKVVQKKIERTVMKVLKPEKKWFDTTVFFNNFTWSGAIQNLSSVVAGDDNFNRQGLRITAKGLMVQGYFQGDSAGTAGTVCRLVIFTDTMNQGIDPVIGNVLSYVGTAYGAVSQLNADHTSRYRILMDYRCALDNGTGQIKQFKKFIKLNQNIFFTNPLSSGIYRNTIYAICICDKALNPPDLTLSTRLSFIDV